MNISSTRHQQVIAIHITENFDAVTSPFVTEHIKREIAAGHIYLVIDCAAITFLSSAGIRVILITLRDARSAGGDIRLAAANGNIKRTLDIAGITKIVRDFATVEEAVASYNLS